MAKPVHQRQRRSRSNEEQGGQRNERASGTRGKLYGISAFTLVTLLFALVVQYGYTSRKYTTSPSSIFTPLGPPAGFNLSRDSVEVKVIEAGDDFSAAAVAGARPVIFRNSPVAKWKARRQWSTEYLKKKIRGPLKNIYENTNRWFGPYFDDRKPLLPYTHRLNPYRTNLTLSTEQFISRLAEHGQDGSSSNGDTERKWIYYSGPLEDMGDWAVSDVSPLNELLRPNPSVSSVNIWMGPPQVVAHCHYDGYHNFYAQLVGRKRFWLGHPGLWTRLQSAPFLHPMHAQCQVNLSLSADEQLQADHNSAGSITAELHEVVLEPGDLLYIPPLWFHHVESVDISVSVNVWTDSSQSEVAMKMFEQAVPGEDALGQLPVDMRALMAITLIQAFVDSSCSDGGCIDSSTSEMGTQRYNAGHFLSILFSARYKPMIKNGLLDLPPVTWHRPLCQPTGASETLRGLMGEEKYSSLLNQVQPFSLATARHAKNITKQTRTIWLGNFVEFVAAKYIGSDQVGHLLEDSTSCI